MPSGGHANSGPPPSADAIRRDRPGDQATWVTLPEKREGPPPPWPLTESSKREDAMWSRLWATPQATQWEAMRVTDEVALYVRAFCEAAEPGAKADVRKLSLELMATLGLSTVGLARRRWRLPGTATPATKEATPRDDRRRTSAKDRLKVIALSERRTA